jgi:hypothetical protein
MKIVAFKQTMKKAVSGLLAVCACMSVVSGLALSSLKLNADYEGVTVPIDGNTCSITFNANGGTKGSTWVNVVYVQKGYVFTVLLDTGFLSAPSGKVFDGAEIDGNKYAVGTTYTVNKNVTIKALWRASGTAPSKPSAVTITKAEGVGKNKVKLTWNRVTDAQGYLIYGQKNGTYAYVGMTSGTTFTDTKALDTDYNYYWVFGYVKYNDKYICGSCTKYVYAKGVCAAVTNLKATSQSGKVRLTWTASAGAEGYLIYGIRPGEEYGYIGMASGTTFPDLKASKTDWTFYWVFPYHKAADGSMVVGGTAKYVYGKAQ